MYTAYFMYNLYGIKIITHLILSVTKQLHAYLLTDETGSYVNIRLYDKNDFITMYD